MVFCAALILYIIFVSKVFTSKTIISHLRQHQYQHENEIRSSSIQTVIVLVSQPRSGSTLLGEFLRQFDSTLYFYEPLQAILKLNEITYNSKKRFSSYNSTAKLFLRQLFNCHFKTDMENILTKVHNGFFAQNQANLCRRITQENANLCSRPRQMFFNKLCNTHKLLLVKLLEPRLPFSLLNMIDIASNSVLHIVYLMRDPRASFWSLLNKGWVSKRLGAEFKEYVGKSCKEMGANLKEIKFMKKENKKIKLMVLRHEDKIEKPMQMVKMLSKFIGREFPKTDVQKFMGKLKKHPICDENEKMDVDWPNWFADAGHDFVEAIEERCDVAMNTTGYIFRSKVNKTKCNKELIVKKHNVVILNDYDDPQDDDLEF